MTPDFISWLEERLGERPAPTTRDDGRGPTGTVISEETRTRLTLRAHETVLGALLEEARQRATEDDTLVPALPEGWRALAWRAVKGGAVGALLALHAVEIAGLVLLWWMLRGQG